MPRGVYPRSRRSLSDRLWSKVDRRGPDECWPWLGAVNASGYGIIGRRDSGTKLAHRVAYELTHGPLAPGLSCCHRCDNPPCCNPGHLFGASHVANLQDMRRKGRQAHGSGHGRARLTEEQVAVIRRRYAGGELQRELAAEFGVSASAVSMIVTGRNWRVA